MVKEVGIDRQNLTPILITKKVIAQNDLNILIEYIRIDQYFNIYIGKSIHRHTGNHTYLRQEQYPIVPNALKNLFGHTRNKYR